MIQLYKIEYEIDNQKFGADIPAKSWSHAKKLADSIGATVLGRDLRHITELPVDELMDFCSAICDEPIRWKYNAREQLEAFLSIGWPIDPERMEDD